jgi:type III secretory pathway lipoprotein EscJ
VKTLLQGAVSNLPADRIEVVMVQGHPRASSTGPSLTRMGPITLTTESAGPFRAFALGLIGLNLALLAICSAMWWRWRKNTHEAS